MARAPVVITLTAEQRALIRQASGKRVTELAVEPVETGAGWLFAPGGRKFWLLKDADPESYLATRRMQQLRIDPRHAHFRMRIGKSRIHRWGVFTAEHIPARRNVIDYIGELVNPVESFRRSKDAKATYAFKLDKFWRIDGSVRGSGAEFINHSCDPNLRSRKLADRIELRSVRPIAAGEELTLDYRYSHRGPRVPCCCGSPKCRGTINQVRGRASKPRAKSRA